MMLSRTYQFIDLENSRSNENGYFAVYLSVRGLKFQYMYMSEGKISKQKKEKKVRFQVDYKENKIKYYSKYIGNETFLVTVKFISDFNEKITINKKVYASKDTELSYLSDQIDIPTYYIK